MCRMNGLGGTKGVLAMIQALYDDLGVERGERRKDIFGDAD